jgi:type-F conjugative transfer system pilin assembly protein TrbC
MAAPLLSAYDLNELAAKMQESALSQNVSGNITISNDMAEKAKQLGYTFDKKKPEIEQWKESMSYEDGSVVFNQAKKVTNKPKSSKVILAEDERIYIFISSSIPKETLVEYAKAIDTFGLGNNMIMVMRGCIGGCEKIKPTIKYITNIITDGGEVKKGLKAQVWIDPLLFRKYGINKAPVFVYAKNVRTEKNELSEGLDSNLKAQPIVYISEGDWDIEHHLKILYQKSKSPSLQKLFVQMKKNTFFNTTK